MRTSAIILHITVGVALTLMAAPAASSQASVQGSWSAPVQIPGVDGTHATLLHTGKVLFMPHRESPSGLTTTVLFDPLNPADRKYQTTPSYFCGGNSQLPDGRVLFNGGFESQMGPFQKNLRATGVYDPVTETWSELALTKRRRWYPSTLQMGDGSVWTFGGMSEGGADNPDNTIERYDVATDTWTLVGGQNLPGQWEEAYNRLHLLPDGRLFQSGHLANTYIYDPVQKTWSFVDQTVLGKPRGDGASVRLQDGRILIAGGQDGNDLFRSAEIIDPMAPNPQWTSVPNMKAQRAFIDAVLLPDGRALVVGGDDFSGVAAATTPELYDPVSNTWTDMDRLSIWRGYHSTALLLPDARVMVASGTDQGGPGLFEESDRIEIWSPPYLFSTPRPVLQTLPEVAAHGDQITLQYTSSIDVDRVVLHRTGSGTHAFNYNQISVPVTPNSIGGSSLTLTIPNNTNLLPPGYYMAFLMSADGVPSVAKWIRLDPTAPPSGPTLTVDGLAAGGSGTLTVDGVGPGSLVAVAYSLAGAGPLSISLACGDVAVELTAPVVLGIPTADGFGQATLTTGPVPPGTSGVPIWFDALDLQTCASPAGVATAIQ